jgi:hypothetical protein
MRALAFFVQLIFWLMVARIVIRWVARLFYVPPRETPRETPRAGPARQIEDLVPCAHCRAHAPRSSMLLARVGAREERYCSAGCRDQAQATQAHAS